MEKQPKSTVKKNLFKSLSGIGLPEEITPNMTWHPREFFKAWKSILHLSKDHQVVDIVANTSWVKAMYNGEEVLKPLITNTALTPYQVEDLFKEAIVGFKLAFEELPMNIKEGFINEELQILERQAKVSRAALINDAWGAVENSLYTLYTEWLLSQPYIQAGKMSKKVRSGKSSNNEEYEGPLLPELLRNPEDIKTIDAWLLQKEYIRPCEKDDKKGPYEWASKNENEEKGVTGKIIDSPDDFREKVSGYSSRYHIAALGLWLYSMKKLSLKNNKYIGNKVGRAILSYYNMEIGKSDGSELGAFHHKNENTVNRYSSYYDGLDEVLSKNPK